MARFGARCHFDTAAMIDLPRVFVKVNKREKELLRMENYVENPLMSVTINK